MSIFVEAGRLIMNLGALGSQFVGVGSASFNGEYIAGMATSMTGDTLTALLMGARLREAWSVRNSPGITAGQSYILWTLTTVDFLELTTGFGPPDDGGALNTGSAQFTEVYQKLASALPDDHWQGSAAQAYADRDTTLQTNAQTLADLDSELAAIVKNQSEWVTHMRLGFGILKDLLFVAVVIEFFMQAMPGAGVFASKGFAITVSAIGITLALGMLSTLGAFSGINAVAADKLTDKYNDVAKSLSPSDASTPTTEVLTAAESTVSGFDAVPAGVSGTPATPGPAGLAGGGSPADERQGAATPGTPGAATPGTPDATATPDATTPPAPASTMPTVTQLAAMSGQTANLPGQPSRYADLANQKIGEIRRAALTRQQSEGAASDTEATGAEDVTGAGAALGAEAAERAPVDVGAAGPQPAQDPTSTQRGL